MRILLLLTALIVSGCAARAPGVAASWQARTLDDLVAAWGPPNAAATLSDGRQVVSYRRSRLYAAGTVISTLECEITYTADARGEIVSTQVRGNRAECNRLVGDRASGG